MGYHSCENRLHQGPRMGTVQNVMLRLSIVLGLIAAVMTVLYFTPLPDQNFKSCDRPCHELDWPMICRIKLNLELYQTMSGSCLDCPNNLTHCDNQYCASGDGLARGIITANRQLPGPSIQVCQNDVLVVDVINKMPGHSLTVHWRGQPNHEAPFMDGVPMVTQCPIPSYTTFQYKFRASSPGTHYYHAHADSHRTDGFFGALIVRQADKIEPHRKLYDIDAKEHVMLLSEWSADLASDLEEDEDDIPKAILINGKAPVEYSSSLSVFEVEKKKRYRFRVAYTSGIFGCPITFKIEKHLMKVIALDGNPINPYEVSSATISKGERFDFVLKTNQEVGAYYVRVDSNCNKNPIEGLAVINYKNSNASFVKVKDHDLKGLGVRNFDTSSCESGIGSVCLSSVKSLKKIPEELRNTEVDRKIHLTFENKASQVTENGYPDTRNMLYRMNNLTFTYPSSPLLTQLEDVSDSLLCSESQRPERCINQDICECVHVEHIPLDASVEVILIDQGNDEEEHVFHLHGYHFYVVGLRQFNKTVSADEIKHLDGEDKLFKRNFNSPALKDTIRLPKNGVAALRFIASNPGFWILRDEQSKGWTRGLDVVFQVGQTSDMVSTPTNFPTCGSFIGPDFFLL